MAIPAVPTPLTKCTCSTPIPEACGSPSKRTGLLIRWVNPHALKSCVWEGGGISNQITQWLPGHGASEACTPAPPPPPLLEEHGIGYGLCSQTEPQLPFPTSTVVAPEVCRKVGDLPCPSVPPARIPVAPGLDRDGPTEHKRVGGQLTTVLVTGLLLQEQCYLWF